MDEDRVNPGGEHDPAANPWARTSRTSVYRNPWIEVFHDEVVRPDGRPGIYGVVHFRNRAVGAVVLDDIPSGVTAVGSPARIVGPATQMPMARHRSPTSTPAMELETHQASD